MKTLLIASQNALVYTNKENQLTGTDGLETCTAIHGIGFCKLGRRSKEKFTLHVDEESNIENSIRSALDCMTESIRIKLIMVPGKQAYRTMNTTLISLKSFQAKPNIEMIYLGRKASSTYIDSQGEIHLNLDFSGKVERHPQSRSHVFFENSISREIMICHMRMFQRLPDPQKQLIRGYNKEHADNPRKVFIEHHKEGWVDSAYFHIQDVYKSWLTKDSLDFMELGYDLFFHKVIRDFVRIAFPAGQAQIFYQDEYLMHSLKKSCL